MRNYVVLLTAVFTLAGCSNFVADFGIPTVRFSSTGFGPTQGGYEVSFEIQPYLGSPSGQILSISVTGLGSLPGVSVPECLPPTAADACPKIVQRYTFNSNPGPLSITGYVAQSLNNTTRTITLPSPVPINP
jgi:hypothetical protein